MRTLIVIFSMFFGAYFTSPNLAGVTKALSEGDATSLATYFDSNMEITLLEKYGAYNKAQATQTMRDFFTKNKPKGFNAAHQGTSKGNASHYTIGELQTANGTFRLSMYYKVGGDDKVLIQEMRIEK